MQTALSKLKGTDVRFGSKADMCGAKRYVRFAPESDRESRHPQRVMSALPLKADICSAAAYVRFGPEADSGAQQNIVDALFRLPRKLMRSPNYCIGAPSTAYMRNFAYFSPI